MTHEHRPGDFTLNRGIDFVTAGGGVITMIGNADHLHEAGVDDNEWAYYDDLRFNAHNDVSLNVAERHTSGSLRHITGDVIVSFNLVSRVPNGKVDIEVKDLAPHEWYRLEFNTVLAKTDGGFAHGQASSNGELIFTGVRIPDV